MPLSSLRYRDQHKPPGGLYEKLRKRLNLAAGQAVMVSHIRNEICDAETLMKTFGIKAGKEHALVFGVVDAFKGGLEKRLLDMSDADAFAALTAVPGVTPKISHWVLMYALMRTDVFPVECDNFINNYSFIFRPEREIIASKAELLDVVDKFRPYRSYFAEGLFELDDRLKQSLSKLVSNA